MLAMVEEAERMAEKLRESDPELAERYLRTARSLKELLRSGTSGD